MLQKKSAHKWEFGDFQTPTVLADLALGFLRENGVGISPETIIDPTCGQGNFLQAAANAYPNAKRIIGIEIDQNYLVQFMTEIEHRSDLERFELIQADFFEFDWLKFLNSLPGPILIVGNPPWVTSSDIGKLRGSNLPQKANFNKYKGIEALTGKSNFDISEWMLMQNIKWLDTRVGQVSMLCKTSVARKILRQLWWQQQSKYTASIVKIDAMKHFSVAVDACLINLIPSTKPASAECRIYDSLGDKNYSSKMGLRNGNIVYNLAAYKSGQSILGGDPNYIWRSGIKHDCSKVMEISCENNRLRNGFGESLDIEGTYLFPLLKGSDLIHSRVQKHRLTTIVTQRKVGQPTFEIEQKAPRTWAYLQKYAYLLDHRGSRIYRSKPKYSIFGVGDYTFTDWKIAISGFGKKLNFEIVGPLGGKPVVFDDTVNLLDARSELEAKFLAELMNSEVCQTFLNSMIYWADKRPITIEILRRINLHQLARQLDRLKEYDTFCLQRSDLPLLDGVLA